MGFYENLTPKLAVLDLPKIQYGQEVSFEKIFKRLLIFDSLPDDNFDSVVQETIRSLQQKDPAFGITYRNDFDRSIKSHGLLSKWRKIVKDYYYFTGSETKRRNRENPYYNAHPEEISGWNSLPDFSKQKLNMPFQFDHLYRDAQKLAGEVHELTKDYEERKDKDLFRAKVNSILVPDKIVFALDSGENLQNFAEIEIMVLNLKISLDALKLGQVFLNRLIESLHKLSWEDRPEKEQYHQIIKDCDDLTDRLKTRILETESKFLLYMDALKHRE